MAVMPIQGECLSKAVRHQSAVDPKLTYMTYLPLPVA